MNKRNLAGKTCLRVKSARFVTKVKFMLYWKNFKNCFISEITSRNKTSLRKKRGFCASPAARADDFTWTNFSPADRAPRLSQVRSQLNGLTRFPCKVKLLFIRNYFIRNTRPGKLGSCKQLLRGVDKTRASGLAYSKTRLFSL